MDIGAPVDRAGAVIPSQAYSISELAEFLRFFHAALGEFK